MGALRVENPYSARTRHPDVSCFVRLEPIRTTRQVSFEFTEHTAATQTAVPIYVVNPNVLLPAIGDQKLLLIRRKCHAIRPLAVA